MNPFLFQQDPRKNPPQTNQNVGYGPPPGVSVNQVPSIPQAAPLPSVLPPSASVSVPPPFPEASATGNPTGIDGIQADDFGAQKFAKDDIQFSVNTQTTTGTVTVTGTVTGAPPANVSIANPNSNPNSNPNYNFNNDKVSDATGANYGAMDVSAPESNEMSTDNFPVEKDNTSVPDETQDVDMADSADPVPPIYIGATATTTETATATAIASDNTSETAPAASIPDSTVAVPPTFNASTTETVKVVEVTPQSVPVEELKTAPGSKFVSAAQAALFAVQQFRERLPAAPAPTPASAFKLDPSPSPVQAADDSKPSPPEEMPPPIAHSVLTMANALLKCDGNAASYAQPSKPLQFSLSKFDNPDHRRAEPLHLRSTMPPDKNHIVNGQEDADMEESPPTKESQIDFDKHKRENELPPAQSMTPPIQNVGSMAANEQQPMRRHPPPTYTAMRELKVEDALNYLDKVKLEFGDRPRIYNEFLEIMKNFKAHEIDTPGVIMRVSDLFRGYNNLILGFNTFLPDGFKISIKDLVEGGRYASKKPLPPDFVPGVQRDGTMLNHSQQMGPGMVRGPPGFMHGQHPNTNQNQNQNQMPPMLRDWGKFPGKIGGESMSHKPNQNQGIQGPPQQQPSLNAMGVLQQHAEQNAQQGGQDENPAIEFDHAITYVTTIKKRFGNEPRTYQQFLEILHTYQKEQRGIREVLEQVSSLFADHPDLLKQFTYFLPEAVQEQAKERLHAAAAEAEARQAAARQRVMDSPPTHYGTHPTISGDEDQEITIDMTEKQAAAAHSSPPENKKRPSSPSNVTLQYPMMPETMIYNAGVERQFFDLTKESLRASSREGDMAWAEFLKCMDLYAQEILSKNDMLRYIEALLGKPHVDLFEEFKRILSAAGAAGAPSHDDAWHSVPLSEIDFSRCRRCTPSYRALPRDYPVAPFSGRSEEEAKILNDVWISLPDGSEESYTFRHMRKNQHEEVLFRCEDERFEIDMVIDSTATALKRLEPIAEEIAMLQQKEAISEKCSGSDDVRVKAEIQNALESGGLGGKTIKYSFDKSILNTIHRHAIARVYGDSGQEMLDLMHKNPVVAIPIVVNRLKQKDRNFRAARDVLNRRWKESAETNFYKSIDHRSLTWRTIDKRATSTRTLAAEIKDRAANNGVESEATVLAKRDKAKEEFGSFYERTMGRYLQRKMDLTNLPKPTPLIFTPHYSMEYENNSWAQRDAYRILSFALERGSTSPGDKERCHRVWTDFLAPFLDLSSIWMQSPAVAYAALPHHRAPSIVSDGNDSGHEDDESSAEEENEMVGDLMVTEEDMKDCNNAAKDPVTDYNLLDNQPIPTGAFVSTVYGDGIITDFKPTDKSYVVSLPFGAMAYLNRNSVLCTILPVDPYDDLEHPIETDEDPLERDDDKFVLGPQSLYLFYRLHQVLIKRLNIARKLSFLADKDQSLSTLIEHMTPDGSAPIGQKRYDAYLSLVYGLLEGGYNSGTGSSNAVEGGKYEDRVRCLLGHNAYELATMDKLIAHILKHLQNLANDDTMQGMIQIFKKHTQSGGFKPIAFRQEASMISEGENMFAFQYCHIPKSDNAVMHVELLGCIRDEDDDESMASVIEANDPPPAKKVKR